MVAPERLIGTFANNMAVAWRTKQGVMWAACVMSDILSLV